MARTEQNPFVAQLRQRIDSRHAEALRALEVLEAYLAEDGIPQAQELGKRPGRAQHMAQGSRRAIVLGLIKEGWHSVSQIAALTSLEEKSVRGVVYAKNISGGVIETKRKNGRVVFHFREDKEE